MPLTHTLVVMGWLQTLLYDLTNFTSKLGQRFGSGLSELGDAGVYALNRRELQRQRQAIVAEVGEYVVHRIEVEGKKTVRADAPELIVLIDRVAALDAELRRLNSDTKGAADDPSNDQTLKPDPPSR